MKSNKKVYFNDDGEEVEAQESEIPEKQNKKIVFDENGEKNASSFQKNKNFKKSLSSINLDKKWYELYDEYNAKPEDTKELKDTEVTTLINLCKSSFNEVSQKLLKNNPSDAKWLETALHKGTSKDRANSGALLVQTNPLPNISALETLISFTKPSNKACVDVLEIVTELFVNSLLPHHRKLVSIQGRGGDWKALKNKSELDKSTKDSIYAYWYYESELKDNFHAFLLNLQANLQAGKEGNKIKAIISASNLLENCPEKESFVLSMIVNKFGDPEKKIASKATYNLRKVLIKHPNMANVIIMETEKLLFRNNVSEMALNQGIGFLSLISRISNVEASQRLINICFSFFKIKIEKGDINSRQMQSILNCLRVAIQNINDFNTEKKRMEITTPDVVNTIYRLIYLSNISIAFQALSLLLQLVLVQEDNHDRYYNALYKKMTDLEITNASNKISSLYFHILHRSIQKDSNVVRAKAFIKRLLQMSLTFPPGKAIGVLIVINKILKSRPELVSLQPKSELSQQKIKHNKKDVIVNKFEEDDDDGEEIYKDVLLDDTGKEIKEAKGSKKEAVQTFSWMHVKNQQDNEKKKLEKRDERAQITEYDPYKRSAAYCGADFTIYYELVQLSKHFHPTVQVFCEDILKSKNIKYFGDPLRDFSLSHFLERFSFKNPKKVQKKDETSLKQTYQAKGSRGLSVHLLTEQNCTEDEKFIFEFLKRKREIKESKTKKESTETEDRDSDLESVGDDEFDEYLDSLGAAGGSADANDKDFDYLSEIQKDKKKTDGETSSKKKQKKSMEESDEEAMDEDWDSVAEDSDDESSPEKMDSPGEENDDSDQSISLDENEGSDSENELSESEMEASDVEEPLKKSKKKSTDSLFVAVDDFSQLIEQNASKADNHGTLGEIFNKDKSSQKQLDWEEKRRTSGNNFKRKNSFKKSFGGGGSKQKKFRK